MNKRQKILISGWFSFDLPYNTAGDILARETAIKWATESGFICDIAVPKPKANNEVFADKANQKDYVAIVFVCGPLTSSHIIPFISRFKNIKKIALNVSIIETHDLSKEFDIIIPRDSISITNPDISLESTVDKVPVIGLIYVGNQKEYPTQRHDLVEELVNNVVEEMDLAIVRIDTKLPNNEFGLTSISQVESVISAMDIVITTRLHGSLLSLRNGVPVISIDPVPNGAKVLAQMRNIGWPLAYPINKLNKKKLKKLIRLALSKESKNNTQATSKKAKFNLLKVKKLFQKHLKEK